MASNVISDKLNEGVTTIEVEAKPTDRELEFAKVTEITNSVRDEFLANDYMTIEEAVANIQASLQDIIPQALPLGKEMPPKIIQGGMPAGMPSPPMGSGDVGSVLGVMPPKL